MQTLRVLLPVTLLVATGCVSERAGYDDVRSLTSARLGHEARWRERESGNELSEAAGRLLAAPLTADSAARIALVNSPALQASFEKLGIARGRLVSALRLPNPEAQAALRYGVADRPEIDLGATLSLSGLLFVPSRNGVARAGLDAATLEVAGDAVELAFQARSTFFDYQAALEALELRRTALASLQASADMAEKLHEAGNVTDLSLASEKAAYEEARIAHARAEAGVAAERERLSAVLGVWGEAAARWTAAPALPEPAPAAPLLADLERRVVQRSLDLALSRARFREAARRANLSRFEGWFPDLKAGVSAERDSEDWGVGPLAELEIPLFYQGQGETAVALAEMRREQKLLTDTAVKLRARARATAARLAAAAESARYYRTTVLPLRQQVLEQTQLEYNAMGAGVFQLLQAKRERVAAEETYVELAHEYWTLRTEAESLLAGRCARQCTP